MEEVIRLYGYTPNRSGFICCPFHGEKTPSLKVYKDHWHCFGCGAGGSVIDFAMNLFHLRFPAAVVRLNADFHLGLSAEKPNRADLDRLKAAQARKRAEERRRENEYMDKVYEFRQLHEAYKTAAPDSEEYAEACRRLPVLEQWFEENPYTEARRST